MKTALILAFLLVCGRLGAQTTNVTFPELRSSAGALLMTNATYRCAVGEKLFFENAAGEHGFKASDLDTNVLGKLGISAAARAAAQSKLNAQNQAALVAHEEYLQQQAAQAQQAAAAQSAAESNALAAAAAGSSENSSGSHKSKKNKYQGMLPSH